ncbi:MAG TPA: hypothetical protein VJV03_02165 [Pyrinomonadaceae bacterium]|nr:hypothetical protein [Pyrinomonadaceae bacterium]
MAMMNIAAPDLNARPMLETLAEAELYFIGHGALNDTLAQLSEDLKRRGIEYVVIGAVALFAHGLRRFTNNIDIVLTAKGLEGFVTPVTGKAPRTLCNYDPDVTSNRRVRSFPHGISIKIRIAGEYPGDGKPKPVRIPEPSEASTEINGIQVVTLEKLVELKLASGISAPHRLKDLADVQELIKVRKLQSDFGERLDPSVRDKFWELLEAVKQNPEE